MVAVLIVLTGGPVASLVTTLLAAISFPILIVILFWLDRYEPEPARYRLAALGWGGVVAVVLSFIAEQVLFAVPGTTHLHRHGGDRAHRRGGRQGSVPGRGGDLPPRPDPRAAGRPDLWRAGRRGLRVRRGHPLLPELPAGRRAAGHVLPPRRDGPVRPSAVHRGHRDRRRHRGDHPPAGGAGARPHPRLHRGRAHARHLERQHLLGRRRVPVRVRARSSCRCWPSSWRWASGPGRGRARC